MSSQKKFSIDLPDWFVHNGKTFEPGFHDLTDEAVFNDLKAAKERLLNARQKEAEAEANRLASLNVTGTANSPTSEGVSMEQIQALVDQSVSAQTASFAHTVEEQKNEIERLKKLLEDQGTPAPDTKADKPDKTDESAKTDESGKSVKLTN